MHETQTCGRESERAGPDHRSCSRGSVERIGKREAERSAARTGGHAARTTLNGEDQRGASARRSAAAEQRKASRPRAQRSFRLHRRQASHRAASHDEAGRAMSRLPERQSVPAAWSQPRAACIGAAGGASPAGSNGVPVGSSALQSVRRSVHCARTGRRRPRKIRRDHRRDDRAAEVR